MAEDTDHPNQEDRIEAAPTVQQSSLALPLALVLAALTAYFGFQTLRLLDERENLRLVKASQEGAIQEAQKVQAQFRTLVTRVGELADKGHAGAKMVMEELFQRGAGPTPQASPPVTQAPDKANPVR